MPSLPTSLVLEAGYASVGQKGQPSALERVEEDLTSHQPDLAIIAYGLNDARCGNPVESFTSDIEEIIVRVRQKTDALVVLVGPYWNIQFDEELWSALPVKPNFDQAFS